MIGVIAYLDPGSGSMILQMLVGGGAAAAVSAKLFWGRIKSFFRFGSSEVDERSPDLDR